VTVPVAAVGETVAVSVTLVPEAGVAEEVARVVVVVVLEPETVTCATPVERAKAVPPAYCATTWWVPEVEKEVV